MSAPTRDIIQKLWSEVKDNSQRLKECAKPHDFPPVEPFTLDRSVCTKCRGWMDGLRARLYMEGRADERASHARPSEGNEP